MPKQLLNNFWTTFKKSRKRVFWPQNSPKLTLSESKIWPQILISEVIYQPFELKIHPKVGLLGPITMPKQLLNSSKTTFENSRKVTFWPQNSPKWPSQRLKIWPKILISEGIYQPFELKIHLKVGLLGPITMPKQHLNSSCTTFENSRKVTFWPQNSLKLTLAEGQILAKNFDFRGHLSTFQLENTAKSGPFKAKNNA